MGLEANALYSLSFKPNLQRCKFFFFLHKQVWSQKVFYPKKCVNYDKSNLQQNSVKGQKDPNSEEKKCQRITKLPNFAKKCNQKAWQYSLSWQNSVNFFKDFFTQTLFTRLYVFHLCKFTYRVDICYDNEENMILYYLFFTWCVKLSHWFCK